MGVVSLVVTRLWYTHVEQLSDKLKVNMYVDVSIYVRTIS